MAPLLPHDPADALFPHGTTLAELGERAVVERLVLPRLQSRNSLGDVIGDDCAVVEPPAPDEVLVCTIDPCPRPVVFDFREPDHWYYGWLTAVINLSDLAAVGATPTGRLVSTVMRGDMTVHAYDRFLQGLAEACRTWSCPVLGGNVKDGAEFSATAAATGRVRADRVLRRTGAAAGDVVCVIGDPGSFWAAVLRALYRLDVPGLTAADEAVLEAALTRPVARVPEGMRLAATGGVSCCTDASDGLGAALDELAKVNGLDVVVDAGALQPRPAARKVAAALGVDPRALALTWGDWELVCGIAPDRLSAVRAALAPIPVHAVGAFGPSGGRLLLTQDGRSRPVADFGSRRFDARSSFTHGLQPYAELLVHGDLYDTGVAERQ
ncbi:thiamine-phosphate kinase [Streptomyces hayashii]|uniref:thiamine-phosphate kinase n=1 Tax=Streptomyces hayashii TaxID=2839966 RepID=UPI00403C8269